MTVQIVKATASLKEALKVECDSRTHRIILDEPEELGGKDEGQTPVEALLSALGACKCIVARMYAESNNIDIQDIKVELEGDLELTGKVKFSAIRSKIYIKSSSPREDVEKYVEFIDNNCPVGETLKAVPKMTTELLLEE